MTSCFRIVRDHLQSRFLIVGILLLVILCPCTAIAQGTKADYERLSKLGLKTRNKVFRINADPKWIHNESAIWYRVQIRPGAFEFVCVDLQSGKREVAFDAESLVEKLEKQTGKKYEPHQLPFSRIDLDEKLKHVFFRLKGKVYRIDRETQELAVVPASEIPKEKSSTPEIRPSGPSRVGVHVEFLNKTKNEVRLFWIDTNGRARGYGNISAGKSVRQHTYLGHVWIVTDSKRNPLAVFDVQKDEQKLTVDPSSQVDKTFPINFAERRRRSQLFARPNPMSPDRKWRVEVKNHDVYLADAVGNKERRLTNDGKADDYFTGSIYWSPDSTKFIVFREKPAQEHKVHLIESSPGDRVQPKLQTFNYLKPGDQIRQTRPALFDVKSQKMVKVDDQLFSNPWRISDFRWSADSKNFYFRYNQRGHQVMRLVSIDADSGQARAIVDEKSPTFIDYNYKFKVRYLPKSREVIWSSERDGWNHLYLYDEETGTLKNQITKGKWLVRKIDRVDEEKRQIWFQAGGIIPNQDPYYIHFCRVNFDGSGLVVMTQGDGTHSISYSPSRKFIVDRYSQVDQPPIHEIREVETGKLIAKLEEGDDKLLRETGWQVPERFIATGRDGETPIFGVIYRPTNFDPAKKYPVIEYIYAGPHGSFVPKSFRTLQPSQSLAELGFIVVQIDGMGTSNRSKAFHDVCWKNLGDSGFPDRIRWIKAAARKYPYMDLSRVGIFGGSAGGQSSTRALLAFGDFYHVAVSDCGCHDNRMDKIWWNEQWMGWPVGPHYAEQSNVTNAHKLKGKLFLIVGELDRNVDPASTLQVVNALIKANKDFDFLMVPGGGHGVGSSPYGRRRTFDFFVRHLHGVEPRSK